MYKIFLYFVGPDVNCFALNLFRQAGNHAPSFAGSVDICVLLLPLCKWPSTHAVMRSWQLAKYQVQRHVKASFLEKKGTAPTSGARADLGSQLSTASLAGCWLRCSPVCAADPPLCGTPAALPCMAVKGGDTSHFMKTAVLKSKILEGKSWWCWWSGLKASAKIRWLLKELRVMGFADF